MTDAKATSTIKVAVTQAEPEWLDLEKAVKKTCVLIEEAASNGAKIISFPEVWLTGYPAWIWSRPVDFSLTNTYIKNSLRVPSPELSNIQAAAAANSIAVVLGFSENHENSLYIAQAIISPRGELLTHRRKIKPTHMERTIFGDAAGATNTLLNTASLPLGDESSPSGAVKVSSLACWEHAQPLLKYHTALQRPTLHVSAWPPVSPHGGAADPTLWSMSAEGCRGLSQTFAVESQAFVLHTTAVLSARGIDALGTAGAPIMGAPGGGSSAVFAPDGRRLTDDLPPTEEGILYAECDVEDVLKAKGFLDLGGHYSRPDILWLGVDAKAKTHVVEGGQAV